MIKVLIPGFITRFQFSEISSPEMVEAGKRVGLSEAQIEASQKRPWEVHYIPSFTRIFERWIDHVLPLLIIDKLLVDQAILEDYIYREVEQERGCGLPGWSEQYTPDATARRQGIVRYLYEDTDKDDRIFETFSAEDIIDSNHNLFQKMLFDVVLDERRLDAIREATKKYRYDLKDVPPWLYESFRVTATLLIQLRLPRPSHLAVIPLLTDIQDEDFFLPVFPYRYADVTLSSLRALLETSVMEDFLRMMPEISRRFRFKLVAVKKGSAQAMAHTILKIRQDKGVREFRQCFLQLYEEICKSTNSSEEITENLMEEINRLRSEYRLLKFKIPLHILSGALASIIGIFDSWEVGVILLPFIMTETFVSVKEGLQELQRLRWIGFFDRFLRPTSRCSRLLPRSLRSLGRSG